MKKTRGPDFNIEIKESAEFQMTKGTQLPLFHTVIPIHNLRLDQQRRWKFGNGLVLEPVPAWVRTESALEDLDGKNQRAVEAATHAFVMRYEAAGMGSPDPTWKGPNPKSLQQAKYEVGVLANLCLWLVRPSPACFTVVLHARQLDSRPSVVRTSINSALLCHPFDRNVRITEKDLRAAGRLHSSLVEIGRDNSIWNAVWVTWAGLQMNIEALRCLLFWVAAEALFGAEDAREITFRLSQRLAFFLGRDRNHARQLYTLAKEGYSFRSKIVHGRWKANPEGIKRMAEVEDFVRQSLYRILMNANLRRTFSEKGRDCFLDDLVFKKRTGPGLAK